MEFYADLDLPDDTRVVEGVYRSTHDYQLDALLEVPAASAPAALKSLNEAFGPCVRSQPSPLNTEGVTSLCTMATVDAITETGEPASRLYVVGTGVRKDGIPPHLDDDPLAVTRPLCALGARPGTVYRARRAVVRVRGQVGRVRPRDSRSLARRDP